MLTMLMVAPPGHGQTTRCEGFEGPEPTWRDAGGNARYRVQQHGRLQGEAHTGTGCERLTLLGDYGTYVHISHEVGRARVIDELLPGVWIKSDRPGLQILAQVVLPRTEDPRTGRPVSTLVRGSSYTNVGRWQQLRIEDVPRLLARQVRILRTQLGPAVDGREAYLDRILLNVYGGPGATNVWIDDLDIAGFVASRYDSAEDDSVPGFVGGDSVGDYAVGRPRGRRVELVGSVLMVDGRPMFPRIIRHRGEPLAFLKELGFNAVWLDGAASAELLQEADRLGLWLVCPPPRPAALDQPEEPVAARAEIGPQYGQVLVWDLGRGLSRDRLDSTERWAEQVRLADRHQGRPLICCPDSDLRRYSRHTDLLLTDRQPLGTSLELTDYGNWIRRGPRLARPGTPIWTTVQTQPAEALRQQLSALEPGRPPPLSASSEQIRLVVYTAVAAGSRGLLFQSLSPLDASDPETRYRAMALELLNLELQLVEPWAAAGSFVAATDGSEPEVVGAVLRTDRARLLLPVWYAPGAQYVPGQSAADGLSLVVPGVPESSGAYELSPGGLRPLRHRRVTGGMRVTLEEFGLSGQVLLSQDPLVVNSLTQRSAKIGPRAAELARNLAARKLHAVGQVADQLVRHAPAAQSAAWMDAARKSLQRCDGYLAAKEYRAAYLHARRAMRRLRMVERAHWEAAVAGLGSPLSSPAAVSFATLPWHWRLIGRIASSRPGPNRLGGGDFEDLQTLLTTGWNHFQHTTAGLRTAADLVPEAAHSGCCGLRLTVRAEDPDNPPAMVETPPMWITSPAVPVEAGQLVCIRGWVHVPTPLTGSVDGLLIIDSLSGEALAERIGRTGGWQQFTLYRAAPQSGRMTVTFALSGLGEVRLDDVTIQALEPAGTGGTTQRSFPDRPLR